MHSLPGLLFLIAGIVAIIPGLDGRISWILVAVAGALMAFF